MQLTQVTDLEFDGISHEEYPRYNEAFVSGGNYKGKPMTEEKMDFITDNCPLFFREKLEDYLY